MSHIHNYCVILAGGVGVRFWPYSRMEKPKQFLDFFGTGRSLLQQTYDRFAAMMDADHIYISTNREYAALVEEQLPDLPERHILLEPMRRNTAPAVTWAAMHIHARDPLANMVVVPSDQLILKEDEFRQSVERGLKFAATSHKLLTMGVKPTRPETAYGYIQISDEQLDGFYKVKSFTEKPEPEFAQLFVESGEFYWNSGVFLWNAETLLKAVHQLIPEIALKMDEVRKLMLTENTENKYIEDSYSSCPNLSIDYGILEKSDDVYVMLCNFGWADIGSWKAFYEASPKDSHDNVVVDARTLCYNSRGNVISMPGGKVVVLEDINNYVIVEHDNVLMICPREKAANMRRYVNDVQIKLGEEYV